MKAGLKFMLMLFVFVACSNTESQNDEKENISSVVDNKICCVPDSNMFALKRTDKTVDKEDLFFIKQLKDLNKEQIKAWIEPIPEKDRYNIETTYKYFKAVAFQKKTEKYSSILLMMIEDLQDDYVIEQQMLITVDNNGKYINGLPVFYIQNLSNSDVQVDSTKGMYQFSMDTRSRFSGDTVKVYQLVDVGKTPQPQTNEDTWQEIYETIYLINPNGEIGLISERKKIGDERDKK